MTHTSTTSEEDYAQFQLPIEYIPIDQGKNICRNFYFLFFMGCLLSNKTGKPARKTTEVQLPLDLNLDNTSNDSLLSEEEAGELHYYMLTRNLKFLGNGKTSPATKQAVINWVNQPFFDNKDYMDYPFSFQTCCLVEGIDPDELKLNVLSKYARHLVDHMYDIPSLKQGK